MHIVLRRMIDCCTERIPLLCKTILTLSQQGHKDEIEIKRKRLDRKGELALFSAVFEIRWTFFIWIHHLRKNRHLFKKFPAN